MNTFKKIIVFCLLISSLPFIQAQNSNEQLAIQYYQEQAYEKAVELFKDLYQKRPDAYYYDYYLKTLLILKEFKEAERLVNKQIKIYSLIQKYKVDLGYVYQQAGEIKKAEKAYESCIYEINHTSYSIKELAQAFQSYQLNDYAVKTLLQGRKISQQPNDFALELGNLYSLSGKYETAITEYLSLIAVNSAALTEVEAILVSWLIDDPNQQKRNIIHTALLKYLNKYPDLQVYSSLMLWLAMQEKDFSAAMRQAKAIDKRYKENGQTVFDIAEIAGENLDFKTALDGYEYILTVKGDNSPFYNLAYIASLHTKFKQISTTYPVNITEANALDKQLENFFNTYRLNIQNVNLFREWTQLKSLYANDLQTAKQLLEQAVYQTRLPAIDLATLKVDLGDILRLTNEVWDAMLLYAQVEKDFPNDTIGHLAKYKNAKLSFYLGEFDWAKAQLDVLRAATSKLIANDAMNLSMLIFDNLSDDSLNLGLMYYARADFLLESNRLEQASLMLDSINDVALYHSLSDDILYKKAEIAIKKNNYPQADSLLSLLIQNYPYDLLADDALYLKASLYDFYIKDIFTAMDLYQQLIKNYPSSIFVVDARKRFRTLRGDVLQQVN